MGRQLVDRGRDAPLEPERISQPTLVLWGEHDRVIPLAAGEELSGQIPGARLNVVRAAGHLPLEEQPEVCNRALLEFLAEPSEAALAPREGLAAKAETLG
jgi:pimeloyl-ACP methyl ester carboxylesterase